MNKFVIWMKYKGYLDIDFKDLRITDDIIGISNQMIIGYMIEYINETIDKGVLIDMDMSFEFSFVGESISEYYDILREIIDDKCKE